MKYAVAAVALAASASAIKVAGTIGDGVPVIYADTPYPNPPYLGTQYNATVIRGVDLNNKNMWPCLTAEKYYTIPPPCSVECLKKTFAASDYCDDNDFTCHCTAKGSAELDKTVVPCLTSGVGECTGEEIGQLANFVHASLCPYFMATTHEEAYGKCDGAWEPEPVPSSSAKNDYWPKPTSTWTSSSKAGYWPKPTTSSVYGKPHADEPCYTSVQPTWTKECTGPTTFAWGSKTWTVTKATTVTVTDCPITWTKPTASGTWAPWVPTDSPVPTWAPTPSWVAAPVAKGTGAYTPPAAQFTGAAVNNKVAGAVAAVAAGAALLI